MKDNGELVQFLRQRDYIMVNNALGSGSFGKAVVLQDPFIDELFVSKKYEPEFNGTDLKERFFKNFLDEIKILYKLNHRNIVRIYNYYAYENISTGYILMEFINGKNIADFINDIAPWEIDQLDDVFTQLIEGFDYIENNGIIHRDIREGNIMVDKSGTVKVIDFGIGKIAEKGSINTDSMVSEINRATYPQEYYDGIYSSKTDIFYLGELLHRLIKNASYIDAADFSYTYIIEKMMSKNPNDRYASFSEIKEIISKHDFVNMKISQADKEIYQNFSNFLYRVLSSFKDERKFNSDTNRFILQLEKALKDNCFEDVIQNNADIIRSVVSGGYNYIPTHAVSCESIKTYLNWYKALNQQSRELVLNNIIAKLSTIQIIDSEPELPF